MSFIYLPISELQRHDDINIRCFVSFVMSPVSGFPMQAIAIALVLVYSVCVMGSLVTLAIYAQNLSCG